MVRRIRPVSHPGSDQKRELLAREDAAWAELHALLEPLTPEELDEDGYYPGWSIKDLMAHYGDWMAVAATMLERKRLGTDTPWEEDTDSVNRTWHEAWRGADLGAVKAHLHAARARMLEEWELLPPDLVDDDARDWFLDSSAGHNDEHLPRLREWIAELRPGSA
jgi:Mycothiol maleylpyruvate isomerase N-terminal domain